ncbi:unnamed protein product [Peniophora sp. CBMAI 1063]|nr:unnamed protein product [Peniophora sp. CBMAI 1063]
MATVRTWNVQPMSKVQGGSLTPNESARAANLNGIYSGCGTQDACVHCCLREKRHSTRLAQRRTVCHPRAMKDNMPRAYAALPGCQPFFVYRPVRSRLSPRSTAKKAAILLFES